MSSLRPGSDRAITFFNSIDTNINDWCHFHQAYEATIVAVSKSKKKPELIALDTYWQNVFPLKWTQSKCFDKSALVQVMKWKITRGKFRPLMKLVESNSDNTVLTISGDAYKKLEDCDYDGALNTLINLKGVGAATASAILANVVPSHVPFMDDVVLEVVTGKRDYTTASLKSIQTVLKKKVLELKACATSEETVIDWTLEAVGRVLWVVAQSTSSTVTPYSTSECTTTTTYTDKRKRRKTS